LPGVRAPKTGFAVHFTSNERRTYQREFGIVDTGWWMLGDTLIDLRLVPDVFDWQFTRSHAPLGVAAAPGIAATGNAEFVIGGRVPASRLI